MSSNPTQKKIL